MASSRRQAPLVVDNNKRIDTNNVSMFVTNSGSFAWDRVDPGTPAGFEYPKGSGKTAVFAAGLWLGATVNNAVRVAISDYSDEYAPGAILGLGPGATPDNPNRPDYKVYKLKRVYADPSERDAALSDYVIGAVAHGAPPVTVRFDGSLSISGDQMLWSVFNDMTAHTNAAGSTAPLGIEVQQTTYAYDMAGPLGSTVFVRYRLINKGPDLLQGMVFGQWVDPDLGGFLDDLVGCDSTRGLGYVYNATDADAIYGSGPPSVGFDLLQGPRNGAQRLPATAFVRTINGTDPTSAAMTYNLLHGLATDGSSIIDPTTGQPVRFMVEGDPVTGTGWLDSDPSDRRFLLASGPFSMATGDSQDVVIGIVVGQDAGRIASVAAMRANDEVVQSIFNGTLAVPLTGIGGAPEISLAPVRPNPAPGRVAFEYTLARDARVALGVFDVQGREVARILDAQASAGRHVVTWDPRTRGGVASGVLFVRCRALGQDAWRRFAIAR